MDVFSGKIQIIECVFQLVDQYIYHMNYQNRRGFIRQSLAAAAFTIVPRHVLGKGWLAPSDVIQMGFIGTGKQSETLLKNFQNRSGQNSCYIGNS